MEIAPPCKDRSTAMRLIQDAGWTVSKQPVQSPKVAIAWREGIPPLLEKMTRRFSSSLGKIGILKLCGDKSMLRAGLDGASSCTVLEGDQAALGPGFQNHPALEASSKTQGGIPTQRITRASKRTVTSYGFAMTTKPSWAAACAMSL